MAPSASVRRSIARGLIAACAVAVLVVGAACSRGDSAAPVASVRVTPSKTRVPLGGVLESTYEFAVAPEASFDGDYQVFVHVNDAEGKLLWADDHAPSVPTSQWRPGQTVTYTRTRGVPVQPYLGDASVVVGLYRDDKRLPLSGALPGERPSRDRSYRVTALQIVPQSENLVPTFQSGWQAPESAPDNPASEWRWTMKSGLVSFTNPKRNAVLFVEYDARPDVFPGQPQRVTVRLGASVLSAFDATSASPTMQAVPLTAAQLGSGETLAFTLDLDKTFVPASLPSGGTDSRELGVRVYRVYLDPR